MKNLNINRDALKNIFTRNNRNKVSVLDLFFDITLIVFISGTSHELISSIGEGDSWRNISIDILELFTVLFIWRIYMIFAIHSYQGIIFRLVTMVVMGSLVIMGIASFFAASTRDTFLINMVGFSLAMFAILMVFFTWISNHSKGSPAWKRVLSLVTTFVIAITIALVALGINYTNWDETTRGNMIIILWTINLLQLFTFDVISSRWSKPYTREVVDLIEERYNVLFVLFSGEGIITIISTFATFHHGKDIFDSSFWYLIISFFIVFGWWWLFNDYITYTKLKKDRKKVNAFTYTMLPFLAAIAVMFVGIALMVQGHNQEGSITFAVPLALIAIIFGPLLMLQEPYRKEHHYYRRRIIEIYIIISGFLFSGIQLLIDILFPMPFLILGMNLGMIIISVTTAFIEYVRILKTYISKPEFYEKHMNDN